VAEILKALGLDKLFTALLKGLADITTGIVMAAAEIVGGVVTAVKDFVKVWKKDGILAAFANAVY
jgi:ribosomal protein L30/L7E